MSNYHTGALTKQGRTSIAASHGYVRYARQPNSGSCVFTPVCCADDQFLGMEGLFFVQKVAMSQILTVLLQGTAKLGVMARLASMTGALSPIFATFDPLLVPSYWIFLAALVVNAIYPSVLLTSKSKHLQREVAAQCDAALGVTYFIVYCIATWVTNSLSRTFPLTPYEYVATIFPLVHILGVARALEENAKPLPMKRPGLERARSTSAMETRLPPRVSVGHVVIALGIVAVIFVRTVIEGLYPFDDWHRACRPCDCDGTVLVSCDVPKELETVLLYLEGRGITDIAKNSLGKTLQSFSLARNEISALAPNALSTAEHLGFLNLGRNHFRSLAAADPSHILGATIGTYHCTQCLMPFREHATFNHVHTPPAAAGAHSSGLFALAISLQATQDALDPAYAQTLRE